MKHLSPLTLLPVALVTCTFISFLTPIYTDEILWKVLQDRLLQDGFKYIYEFPQCPSSFLMSPEPITLIFGIFSSAYYWTIFQFTPPVVVKIFGVSIALLLYWQLFLLVKTVHRENAYQIFSLFVVLPMSMGILPYITTLNRPEQIVMVVVSSLLLFTLKARPEILQASNSEEIHHEQKPRGVPRSSKLTAALLVIGFIATIQKTPLIACFLPVLLVATYLLVENVTLRIAVYASYACTLLSVSLFWIRRVQCPENPTHEGIRGRIAIPQTTLEHLIEQITSMFDFTRAYGLLGHSGYSRALASFGFRPSDSLLEAIVLNPITQLVHVILLLLCSYFLSRTIINEIRNRDYSPMTMLSASLVVTGLFFIFIAPERPVYRTSLTVYVWACALVLVIKPSKQMLHSLFVKTLATTSLLAQCYFVYNITTLAPEWLSGGYIKTPYSFSPFNFEEYKHDILLAGEACGIREEERTRYLLADELAHEVYKARSQYPIYHAQVASIASDLDVLAEIGKLETSGAVGRCSNLRSVKNLGPLLIETVGTKTLSSLCCVSGSALQEYAQNQ